MRLKLIAATLGVCLLVACSSSTTPTAVPIPTATPPLIVTSGGPVVTATTEAAIPATPEPTSTIAPTLPAPTEVVVTPQTISQVGPDQYPDNVDPLTGLEVADATLLNRRPLAVKVSEFPRRVRPQDGLSYADLVFEHYAEAGVSRMTAIFLGNDSPKVGSIRSARLIDLVLTESYKSMLITSGSSAGVLGALSKTPFFNRLIAEATGFNKCPPLCREGTEASTNNLFASTADLWKTTDTLGLNGRQDLHGLAFFPTAPAGGQPATTVHIDFQLNENTTEWRYDATSGRYARFVDTDTVGQLAPHTDAVNNQQLTATNVVLLYANHVTSPDPEDFGNGGHCGYEIQLWNSGPAKIFRDGQAYDATWARFKSADEISLVDASNKAFALKPGNTWFEVVNLGSPTTFAQGLFSVRFKGPSQQIGCPIS